MEWQPRENFNLDMALRLRRILKDAGANVIITRDTDTYSYLFYRSAFVNKYIVDLEIDYQKGEKSDLEKQKDDKVKELDKKESELATAEAELQGLKDALEDKENELGDLVGEKDLEDLELELKQERDEEQSWLDKLERIQELREIISKQEEITEDELAEFKKELQDLEDECIKEFGDLDDLENVIQNQQQALSAIKAQINDLDALIDEIKDLKEAIQEAEAKVVEYLKR